MTKKYITPMALCINALILGLGLASCAYNDEGPRGRPPGHYEHNTSHVNDNGTRIDENRSTDIEIDENGNRRTQSRTRTTRDPKGLFNKKTTSESYEQNDRRY